MDIKEAAIALHGSDYREEGSSELFKQMKAAGLVAVFGASDDLMEFRGAIDDEAGAGIVYLTNNGILFSDCESEDCPYFKREQEIATTINAIWGEDGISWQYKINIPHEKFDVLEDEDIYCRGIVFRLEDILPNSK